MNVPNFGLDVGTPALRDWADLVESTGLGYAMVSDHVVQTPDVQGGFPGGFFDPFVTLAWLAATTSSTRLGTTVTVLPYRHPALTARLSANIDQLSGGRMILGVSAGWSAAEFAALGVPYADRGRVTDAYLRTIRALWRGEPLTAPEETGGADGLSSDLRGVVGLPTPVTGAIDIWVGGHSPAALRRAALLGDAWHPTSVPIDWLLATMGSLHRVAERYGRPAPRVVPRIKLRLTDTRLPDARRLGGEGSPDQVRHDIERLARAGITDFLVDTTYVGQVRDAATDAADRRMVEHFCAEIFDTAAGALR